MTVHQLDLGILVGSAVLIAAVLGVRFATATGAPSLLLYLGLGVAIGEDGLGLQFADYELTQVLGYAALVLILTEGGLTTRWRSVRSSIAPAALLATVGTGLSVAIVGVAAHLLLGVSWTLGLLLGAVVSSTDAAAVFSVLRRVPLPARLVGLLEAESGFNDAPVVLAVVALTGILGGSGEPGQESAAGVGLIVAEAAAELAVGTVVGLVLGWAGARMLRVVALPSSGLYPITTLAICALAYGASVAVHGSGFLAVYLAALVLGNAELPHRAAVRSFAEGFGWLAQIGLFVLLGLLVTPHEIPGQVIPALVVGAVLLLVARPASVLATVSWFRVGLPEQALLSWGGLRGAVPIVLATVPVVAGVRRSAGLVELVFVLVVAFTLLQAPTLPVLARWLRLASSGPQPLDVEASPLGALGADVLQVAVGATSLLHGLAVFELRLPAGADVSLVVRDGAAFVPEASSVLERGDDLILVVAERVRHESEERLRLVSEHGRLASWRAARR